MKRKIIFHSTIIALFVLGFSAKSQNDNKSDLASIYEGVEFSMPRVKETEFPNTTVSIKDYGGVNDGMTKNTEAFSRAIAKVSQQGGGTVTVPQGIWLTGPIIFKDNINLHLESGALIIFSRDFDDYPLIKTSFEGLNTVRCTSPIMMHHVKNVAITGNGIMDGSGDAWRYVKKGKMTEDQWKSLVASGGVLSDDGLIWFPSESSKKGHKASSNFNVPDLLSEDEYASVKDFLRPVLVSISRSKTVLLDGPTFQNSPAWNLHPLMSEDIIVRNVNVKNPWYSQNGDGIDLESCKNVLIYNNTFDVGDDAICIKSGKNKDGRDRNMPTENVIVKNNTVYHAHGGFVIGSEMSSGVKNFHVSNCVFIGTDSGLRFKSTRGRGGVVENIYISNIYMVDIKAEAIRFNMFYSGNSPVLEQDEDESDEKRDETNMPVTEETPVFRNIVMKNIYSTGSKKAAFFMGLPEQNLQNVRLENSTLEAKEGIAAIDVDGLELKNVKVFSNDDSAITIYNSKNIQISDFSFKDNPQPVKILGGLSDKIQLKKKDFENPNQQIHLGKEVGKNIVTIN